jgi:hypothetical protein
MGKNAYRILVDFHCILAILKIKKMDPGETAVKIRDEQNRFSGRL